MALLGRDQHDVAEQKSGRVSALSGSPVETGRGKVRSFSCASAKRSEKRDNVGQTILPGMQSKSLVLTLDNKELQLSDVQPEFPKQPFAIAMELDKDGETAFWPSSGAV
jgi:hypothetical protein